MYQPGLSVLDTCIKAETKSFLIDSENYLLAVIKYSERSGARKKLVQN